jgi:hypothetical protein
MTDPDTIGSDALMPPEAMARLTQDARARALALAEDDRRLSTDPVRDRTGGLPEPGEDDPNPGVDKEVEY